MTPTKSLLQGMPYTHSTHTDIRKTWAKFGWTPVNSKENESESKPQQQKSASSGVAQGKS